MKIGILTFHDGPNHGAFLQAFCLAESLRDLGHDPWVLNYKNPRHAWQESFTPLFHYRRPVRFVDHIRKRRVFARNVSRLPLTPYTRDPDVVRSWEFDAVVVGSDVVWDTTLFGFDPLFFGDLPAPLRITYAASCGQARFAEEIPEKILSGIRSFNAVSVRDGITADLVEAATNIRPPIVLDPVLLHESLMNFAKASSSQFPPYALVYGDHFHPEYGAKVRRHAERNGWRLVSVGYRNHWADHSVLNAGPLDLLSWFHGASFVHTSTFHGTVLALRYHKRFAVYPHSGNLGKVTALLDMMGYKSFMAQNSELPPEEILNTDLDAEAIETVLKKERASSLEFLRRELS